MTCETVVASRKAWIWAWLSVALLLLARIAQAQPACSSSCPYETCILSYGAAGFVRDQITGEPIEGATIVVLDLEGASAADGSYRVEGSRVDSCHLDWFWSMTVSAAGYQLQSLEYYASETFPQQLTIELEPVGLPPTPTPCPIRTPCILGERPRPCSEPCGLGCGCESCPPCAPGEVLAPHANSCECVDPLASPTPTPTPNPCHFSTPPLCPTGHQIECAPGVCPEDCRCEPCTPCPEGLVYSGQPYDCTCVDPTQFTLTPTPTPTPTGPTPTVCPEKSRCPADQRPRPCSDPCGLHCGCEPDTGNTDTPTPAVVFTGTSCPERTPPQCSPDETLDCDFTIDQCGQCQCAACAPCAPGFQRGDSPCECVAIAAQPPEDRDNEASVGSSGSCAIAAPSKSDGGSWALVFGALILWRRSRFGGGRAGG